MAMYVKGEAVANAASYELAEKTETVETVGTMIESPSNLRGGAVDYIIVRPEVYADIIGKRITKIHVYKANDSSGASIVGIGKVSLSGEFASSAQTVSGLATAYGNISEYKTYDVSAYSAGSVMELDCDITLADGEYLCFETKNGHCVGYCDDHSSVQQMMYVYNSKVSPSSGTTTQHVPIKVDVVVGDLTYETLTTASEINFEVSALGLDAGDHTLVVKAKADGYEDSPYSNEVTYTAT